jgi:hypothetical protein
MEPIEHKIQGYRLLKQGYKITITSLKVCVVKYNRETLKTCFPQNLKYC